MTNYTLLEQLAASYFVNPVKRQRLEHQSAMEDDALLIYQEHRPSELGAERRVFYIDMGKVSPQAVSDRLQEIKKQFLNVSDQALEEIEQAITDDWESESDPDK